MDRTLSMMEVHPDLVRLRRERAEKAKRIIAFLLDPKNRESLRESFELILRFR
jgi:hypothetical protein